MWECCQSQFQLPIGLRGIATICPSKRFPPLRALGTDRRGCRSLSEPYRGLLSVAPGRGVAATGGIWDKNHLNPIGVPCAPLLPHATAPHMEPRWGSFFCIFVPPGSPVGQPGATNLQPLWGWLVLRESGQVTTGERNLHWQLATLGIGTIFTLATFGKSREVRPSQQRAPPEPFNFSTFQLFNFS